MVTTNGWTSRDTTVLKELLVKANTQNLQAGITVLNRELIKRDHG